MVRLTEDQEKQGHEVLVGAGRTDGDSAFAVGEAAQHEYGVMYQGEWETLWDGTATAVRLHARALEGAGIPVLLKSFSGMVVNRDGIPQPAFVAGIPKLVRDEVGKLDQSSIATFGAVIKHVVVHDAEQLRQLIVPRHAVHADAEIMMALRKAVYDSTALYSVWERDRLDPAVADVMRRCGQCWVPCGQNRKMLIDSGVTKDRVHVVPHPFDPDNVMCQLTRRNPAAQQGRKNFYSIGRWEPRKGYDKLIEAFMIAYGTDDSATLTIKHSGNQWKGYPSPAQVLADVSKRYGAIPVHRVKLIGERIPRKDVVKLHFDSNIYVCSSHGEAWCLPAFEAKVAGNAMVHVPYGGTADFAGEGDHKIDFRMGPVHPSYGWPSGTEWADYAVEDLASALWGAHPPRSYEREPWFEQAFSMEAVGKQMRELIIQLVQGVDKKAAASLRAYGSK